MASWILRILLGPLLGVVFWAGPLIAVDESYYSSLHLVSFKSPIEVPNFALRNLSGKRVRWGDFKGKVVLLNFWATW